MLSKLDNKSNILRNNNDNNRCIFSFYSGLLLCVKLYENETSCPYCISWLYMPSLSTIITNIIYMLTMPQRENHICVVITKGQQHLLM